ncbi:MAG: peptide chain release factor N(5)-glutamine methyltransferase [Cyanobium sp.]
MPFHLPQADLQPPEAPAAAGAVPQLLTGAQLLAWRRSMLAVPGSGPASAAALDWLLDLAGGLSMASLQMLWLHPERQAQLACPLASLEQLWRRHRGSDEPLQYLVGRCPWRDLELDVGPGVLIPRQETELLIDLALSLAPHPPPGQPRLWADLGTGSGALAIALARAWPGSEGLAVETSSAALQLASLNLARERQSHSGAAHGGAAPARVQLLQGDWWQAIRPWWGRLQLVVSNPPYIPSATLAGLDPVVRDHEPSLALDGGSDGLSALRTIIAGASEALAPGGVLLLEHHHDQSAAVQALLAQAGARAQEAHRDLEGVLRFASARWGEPLP